MWRPVPAGYTLQGITGPLKNIRTFAPSSIIALPAGKYTFKLDWKQGSWYLNGIERTQKIKSGHVYQLKSEVSGPSIRTWIEDITDTEAPVTVEFKLADIGDTIDESRYDCVDRNSRGDGVYTWVPKGFPASRWRAKLDQFDEWDAVTFYADKNGTVTGRDIDLEYRLRKESENSYAGLVNSIESGLRRGDYGVYILSSGHFKTAGAVSKEGTYNGHKATMNISPGGAQSAVFWEDENADRIVFKIIQRTGIIPGFNEQ